MTPVVSIARAPSADWDELAVDRPGGHLYQGTSWAEHRRLRGWQPRFVTAGELRILALARPWPLIGGAGAYVPRGPAPVVGSDVLGPALLAATSALAADGIDVVAVDAEVPAGDAVYREWLRRAGFHPIAEIQPARHRIALPLGEGTDEDAVFRAIGKATRQRIHQAEKDLTIVVRHDRRAVDGPGDGFVAPKEPAEAALERFHDLLRETGQRRGFTFGPHDEFVEWWRRALAAGRMIYLEARDATDRPLAGLILYRHGGRLTTVHSADRADARRSHPGTFHLLRWRAIQLAIREGCSEMDLGGVDVPGARRVPLPGEPMYGLYQHKLTFGGLWVELAGAHERVIRRPRYLAGRVAARIARIVRP